MKLDTIGKNIRKFREIKKLRQEDLAEKTDLTTNYIGMIERGEKIPSLETFINILNSLGDYLKKYNADCEIKKGKQAVTTACLFHYFLVVTLLALLQPEYSFTLLPPNLTVL